MDYRAAEIEERIWEFVVKLLHNPQRLRAGLEGMIEQERVSIKTQRNPS